jgi:hypothetical protein
MCMQCLQGGKQLTLREAVYTLCLMFARHSDSRTDSTVSIEPVNVKTDRYHANDGTHTLRSFILYSRTYQYIITRFIAFGFDDNADKRDSRLKKTRGEDGYII